MRRLTDRERWLIRFGAIGIVIYLFSLYGLRGWQRLESKRADTLALRATDAELERDLLREQGKARRLQKLKAERRIDLDALDEDTLVGEANAAIQKSAQARGLTLGASSESPGTSSGSELAVFHLEAAGTTQAAMDFVHSLGALGYPLVIDWLQFKTATQKPGEVQLSLRVVVLNASAWKRAADKSRREAGA